MLIHQSMLTSWIRCPQAMFLERTGNPGIQTSALSFGTVMHYAIEIFEREWRTGTPWRQAKAMAVDTFKHYWHPMNIDAVSKAVELWLPQQSYGTLAARGVAAIEWYAEWARTEDEELLATEFGFQVPVPGTWDYDTDEPHILAGTLDRLSTKYYKRKPILQVGDLKSGKDYPQLRQNLQFTAYCMATTRREFWEGWRGEDGFRERGPDLYERFKTAARQGVWISLKSHKIMNAGWRGPDDYTRFALAVEQVVASMKADIYPMSVSGENCSYCPHREICGGVGVPKAEHGAPA